MAYEPDTQMVNPVKAGGMTTEKMAAVLVLGSLAFLIAVNRGFRGVSISGATGGLVK